MGSLKIGDLSEIGAFKTYENDCVKVHAVYRESKYGFLVSILNPSPVGFTVTKSPAVREVADLRLPIKLDRRRGVAKEFFEVLEPLIHQLVAGAVASHPEPFTAA